MKKIISFVVIVFSLLSLSVSAQNLGKADQEVSTAKTFKLDYNSSLNQNIDISLSSVSLKTNHFLTGTGYLLQGLKFSSAVDQFNAVTPFDFRAYDPLTFSSYSESIQKNQLLLNSIQPLK